MNRRRIISIVLLMVFILSSILPMGMGYATTSESITLDSALYTALKSNLEVQGIQATYNDMQYTITISDEEVAKVTNLTLSNSKITNLSGLEKFSNVTSLDLSANELTDDTDLSVLNSMNLTFLDLSSNQLSDLSEITNINSIVTLNLHNQIIDKVEVIDNSIVKEGTYIYEAQLPQIIREFAKPIKADWLELNSTNSNLKFEIASFNSNSDAIALRIGSDNGTQYVGLATLAVKIDDINSKLYNSEINVHFVVINEDQRAIFLKDKKLYNAVKSQLSKAQTINENLTEYTANANLYDVAYDKQQVLVINQDDLVNKISSLVLDNKQLKDLSGLEMFVGLEKDLDVSSNYVETIDAIVDLQAKKDEEEAKLQARFRELQQQLSEKVTTLESLITEVKEVIKTYNEAVGKYNSYVESTDEDKTTKMLEQLNIIKEKGKRYIQLTGKSLTIGYEIYTLETIDKLTEVVGTSVAELNAETIEAVKGSDIEKAETNVKNKLIDIQNTYKDTYKVTTILTPEFKKMEMDEIKTLEQAKTLLQAQIEKITSLEKYFTSAEKISLARYYENLDFSDETKTPLKALFEEKLKDFEANKNIQDYIGELRTLRDIDDNFLSNNKSWINYAINLGGQELIAMATRIAKAGESEILAYVVLPRLESLNMTENLIGNIEEITVLKELKDLYMAENEIVNINNVNWAAMVDLNTLDLSFNNISDIKVLQNIKKLTVLDVSSNLISGALDFTISKIDNLIYLDLSNNQIDDIENFKSQFEFIAKEKGMTINEFIKSVEEKINLDSQDLDISLTVEKTSNRIKVELPKIFRQLEEIDWERTSFGINSLLGNAASDGTYVILETPVVGTRIATVTVIGAEEEYGIGYGTSCTIEYTVVDSSDDSENVEKPEDNNGNDTENNTNVQINVNTATGSSVSSVQKLNDMNYIVVSKNTTVSQVLNDVTLNSDAYTLVIKDANAENVKAGDDTVKTNETIIVEGLSEKVQCKLVVKGDTTGDGSIDLGDILKLNEHRLDNTNELTDAEFIAGNVIDTDAEINMSDILGLNEYRLSM